MPYTLVIVESPAKAKTIEKYLPEGYHVVASQGHLIDLPKSKLGIDIEDNFKPIYQAVKGKGPILNELKKAKAKADEVILATDADREGEAISYHLANYLGIDLSEHNRIIFNEITPKAITEAMQNKQHVNLDLVDAQQARRVLDRLVGYQISPVLWKKVMRGLSAGRVQSVAMRMIVDRENAIDAFVPEEYWIVDAILKKGRTQFTAHLTKIGSSKAEIHNEQDASRISEDLQNASYVVQSVKKAERTRKPLQPFITSTLQQEAYSKLGFTTKRTMAIAQQLYEGLDLEGQGHIGLITYMRTDSTRLSDDAVAQAVAAIESQYGKKYLGDGQTRSTKKAKSLQDAHEAIRPTDANLDPEKLKKVLTNDQYKLYSLIYRRYLASRMAPAIYSTIAVDILADGNYTFHATGSKIKFDGFLAVYDVDAEKEETSLPEMAEGDIVKLSKLEVEQKFTQPPPRFTEASLVKALEEEGIGRPSTYSPTISTIQNRNYVSMEDRKFVPTDLGKAVIKLMVENFASIVDLGFTASMEEHLDKIADGKENWVQTIADFYEGLKVDLDKADDITRISLPEEETDEICEKCGKKMVIKYGRYGRFLACPGYPECKNAKAITKSIEVQCPICGMDIIERKTKKNRIFYGCKGYPECDWTSWYKPRGKDCPKCGNMLFIKGKKAFCQHDGCDYSEDYNPE